MDVLEIISEIRNITNLHTEKDLPTPELLRDINSVYLNTLLPLALSTNKERMYRTQSLTDQTGETVDVPADAETIIGVKRGDYPCVKVPLEKKQMIGVSNGSILQYPDNNTYHPLYLLEGRTIRIYPELDDTDVVIDYKPYIPGLIFGKGTISANNILTLEGGTGVQVRDDVYNTLDIHLYEITAGVLDLVESNRVSDYDGSALQVTLENDYSGSGTIVYYALVPMLPDLFHNLLSDGALVELMKAGKYPGNYYQSKMELMGLIRQNVRLYNAHN